MKQVTGEIIVENGLLRLIDSRGKRYRYLGNIFSASSEVSSQGVTKRTIMGEEIFTATADQAVLGPIHLIETERETTEQYLERMSIDPTEAFGVWVHE
ncbi:MAG: hypothetical protein AAF182_04410 [Pseudomonadota bacterium]